MYELSPFARDLSFFRIPRWLEEEFIGGLERRNLEFYENDDEIDLKVDLPGIEKENIVVVLENQTLSISAERKGKKGSQSFGEKFLLPRGIDPNTIEAEYKNGVLEIKAKKREEDKPKKIPIKVT